ncbi:MAG: 1-deoxy-D-xylulose-5-phosphate synthase [Rickettsiales bacterium]|nr:1-deoxy-D-xylulose-5-phosphate synthase [Rickettsiales bacterium]
MDVKDSNSLLDSLNFPNDLKTLSMEDFDTLAKEIRTRLIEIGQSCGGHLASNLGVVELSLVLHSIFESPKDKILWDTSHQTYVHKMLTGRLDKMFSIRQEGGLSGFANIFESEHDTFGAGHASTALSAGLGVAFSRNLQGEDYSVISVIGDASLSGGMSFEAINNVDYIKNTNFICILNDNNMSISKPVGNVSSLLTNIRTNPLYDKGKEMFDKMMVNVPKGESLRRRIEKSFDSVKNIILDQKMGSIFEQFGFKYLGPIDGHNIAMLTAALKYAKTFKGPILIHAITQKGKGHQPAEEDPIKYHGVSPKQTVVKTEKPLSHSEIFGKTMIDICNKRDDVVVVTPAMTGGSGLTEFSQVHPDRHVDVGIAEEHAVTFCAGLSRVGTKPVLAIYSTFLQRGYDQLIHDVCIQNLPMVFALDRAGFAGQDGQTHHGVFDYSFMLPIPNMTILAPKDGQEITEMLNWSVEQDLIVSIRFAKGSAITRPNALLSPFSSLKSEVLHQPKFLTDLKICIIGVGSMAWPAYEAAKELEKDGINCVAINLRVIKPLDEDTLLPYVSHADHVIVVEEGTAIGGVYHHIFSKLAHQAKPFTTWNQIAIPDRFFDHGSISSLRKQTKLDKNGIVEESKKLINQPAISQQDNF